MIRLKNAFQQPAFVAYLTAGDPDVSFTIQAALALEKAGVNLLEIGVPFSDPIADGPVIQNAMQRALRAQVSLTQTLQCIHALRQVSDIPIVLFTYCNPLIQAGDSVYQRARDAGVDGILVVDCPLEESEHHRHQCQQHQLASIGLISNTTPLDRIERINRHASGFIYYVCRNATTGMQQDLPEDFAMRMQRIQAHTTLPVVTGFGISSKQTAHQALRYADGFVVGSYFMNAIANGATANQLQRIAQHIDPRRTT